MRVALAATALVERIPLNRCPCACRDQLHNDALPTYNDQSPDMCNSALSVHRTLAGLVKILLGGGEGPWSPPKFRWGGL